MLVAVWDAFPPAFKREQGYGARLSSPVAGTVSGVSEAAFALGELGPGLRAGIYRASTGDAARISWSTEARNHVKILHSSDHPEDCSRRA